MFLSSFNFKIKSEEDLRKVTSLPIIGHIPHSKLKTQTVFVEDPAADISEAFRSLRMRLQFLTKNIKSPVILLTSSIPGEGKTFAVINLSLAFSLAGKRVLMVGFDLRKPKIYKELNIDNSKGLSTYLIGRHSLSEIIQSGGYKHLHIITAGPLSPNPAELASSKKAQDLIASLKTNYDLIIVDSSPIGTVSDSLSLASLSDVTIIVVRHNQTYKQMLETTLTDTNIIENKNLNILLNDLPAPTGYHGYAYRYSNYSYPFGKLHPARFEQKLFLVS
jgi:capsular exopolysaccharide synthesis family protein